MQYLIGTLVYFFTGGLLAMAIGPELLSPSYHIMSPTMYLEVVGEHGTMMMMMMTSVILGPFGNYLVPLMIGSKKVAFPRIEALSFWLTPCAYLILLSSFLTAGSRLDGPVTRRCPPRRARAWTPTRLPSA